MHNATAVFPVSQVKSISNRDIVFAALVKLAPSGRCPLAMMRLVKATKLDPRDIWEEIKALAYARVIRLSGEWGAMLSPEREDRTFLDSDGKPIFVHFEIDGGAA